MTDKKPPILKVGITSITRDDHCWVAYTANRPTRDGTIRMKNPTYHATLQQAIAWAGDQMVLEVFMAAKWDDVNSLAEEIIKRFEKELA